MAMNISLTPQLEEMIRQKIASGSYSSASEVVREALRLMELEDQMRELKLQRLREEIQKGFESGPASEFQSGEAKKLGRKRLAAKSERKK
jgi:antitoxin ParD1/3/4